MARSIRRSDQPRRPRARICCRLSSAKTLLGFDFAFNKKINRALVFELATARFVAQREDALLIGPPGTGKSHLAQAIGRAAIQQGYRVIYREAHAFLEELAEATLAETHKDYLAELTRVPLLIIDDLGMRKLPHTAAEDLLELIMRRYERASPRSSPRTDRSRTGGSSSATPPPSTCTDIPTPRAGPAQEVPAAGAGPTPAPPESSGSYRASGGGLQGCPQRGVRP